MISDQLAHHTAKDGYIAYGRDGGNGRDIVIAPSRSRAEDRLFSKNINAPDTSVVVLLDKKPNANLDSALQNLMSVWDTAVRGNVYVMYQSETLQDLRNGFIPALFRDMARQGLPMGKIQERSIEALRQDIHDSIALLEDTVRDDALLKFRMVHYPPASKPVRLFHDWHPDVFPRDLLGKMRLQRSLNHAGMRFAFKEQANPEQVVAGVGLSPGRVMFKITEENVHKAPPISPTEGRVMYTITGTPRVAFAAPH